MEVYKDNLLGEWLKEGSDATYRFYPSGNLIIKTGEMQYAVSYEILTKERKSYLIIDHKKFPFVIMNPGVRVPYFTIITKSGMVTFNKLN